MAELGREDAQRRSERSTVFLSLDHGCDDATNRLEVDSLGEVLEGLTALIEKAQLDRGQAELVAKLRIGFAEFPRNAGEGGINGQARLRSEEHTSELQSHVNL